MSQCKLDHSVADVQAKLRQQAPFLPEGVAAQLQHYLQEKQEQHSLNEIFHLLKKYDLSSTEEQQQRNKKITELLHN